MVQPLRRPHDLYVDLTRHVAGAGAAAEAVTLARRFWRGLTAVGESAARRPAVHVFAIEERSNLHLVVREGFDGLVSQVALLDGEPSDADLAALRFARPTPDASTVTLQHTAAWALRAA